MFDPDAVFKVFLCPWFIIVGACVGSFLNVLVYRLPRRKSLIHPPSHCPRCNHLIRWHDNLPVVGWFQLRGKCRDCRLPISVRYPCIEGLCGILFGSVFILIDQLWSPPFDILIALTLLISVLGTVVLAVCLMAYDKRNGR